MIKAKEAPGAFRDDNKPSSPFAFAEAKGACGATSINVVFSPTVQRRIEALLFSSDPADWRIFSVTLLLGGGKGRETG